MNAGVDHRHSEALAPGAVIDAPGRTILASTPLSQTIQHMYDRATKMLVGFYTMVAIVLLLPWCPLF